MTFFLKEELDCRSACRSADCTSVTCRFRFQRASFWAFCAVSRYVGRPSINRTCRLTEPFCGLDRISPFLKGYVLWSMDLGGTLIALYGLIWLCTRNVLSRWFLVVILVFSSFNFTQSWTVRDNVIPSLYLCTKTVCLGIANLIPFVDWAELYETSGITFDLDLDCLSFLILNRTVWYYLNVMLMFFSFVCFALYWDYIKNLDDGLRIPFDVLFVLKSIWSVETRRLWL